MAKALTPTMHHARVYARKHGGKLYRYPGGYWAKPNWQQSEHSFGTLTIEGLVSRGVAEYSDWREGRNGRFPVEVTVTPE